MQQYETAMPIGAADQATMIAQIVENTGQIDLREVGAYGSVADGTLMVKVGLYLPGITAADGYALVVRIIHEADQFTPGIDPEIFPLNWIAGHPYDLWEQRIELTPSSDPRSHFGQPGRYLYRYQLLRNQEIVTFWFADPFGHMAAAGTLSAVEVGVEDSFTWEDADFTPPPIHDLVVYELMVDEFNQTFEGVIARLDYLQGLGINAIEFMPLTNIAEPFRWGYMPLAYFAPEDRYGGMHGMKRLVNECHKRGIAVIVDAVYAHSHPEFAYNTVYTSTGRPNPMMGRFAEDGFGLGTDYTRAFTRQFFQAVNRHWLDTYHVDGFRYDYVPGFYDGPIGMGYAALVYETYQYAKSIPRLTPPGSHSRLIQCAEHLPDPQGIVSYTYSNSTWQNSLLAKAEDMARHRYVDDTFAYLLDLNAQGYPDTYHNPHNGDGFPVSAFQYIETHDHSRLITQFGTTDLRDAFGQPYGDRERCWFKLQPFVIALYTCQGVPMLWQGQEFIENYSIPYSGFERVLARRPLRWEFFYDQPGKAMIRLYRLMGQLRQHHRALRSRNSFYYREESRPNDGVIIYRREAPANETEQAQTMLILLNFSDSVQTVSVPFPEPGAWHEQIDGHEQISVPADNLRQNIAVPSNYGKIFLHQDA